MTYDDIKSMVGSKTAAEIADALNESGVTNTPINRANLMHLLNMRDMFTKLINNNADEKWTGTVLNMQTAILAVGTDVQKVALKRWLSHITNVTNTIWDTTEAEFAKPFLEMVTAFAGKTIEIGGVPLKMPTSEDFAAVVALGGGYKYNVTANQVQTLIDRQAKLDLIASAKTAHDAERAKYAAAVQNCELLEGEVDSLTEQQVTAEIAEIATFPETYTVPGGE